MGRRYCGDHPAASALSPRWRFGYNLVMSIAPFADRVIAELVRIREEAAGHPADCPAADEAARHAGGGLVQRIVVRAGALPGSDAQRRRLRRLLGGAAMAAMVLAVLAGLAGIAAAATALGAREPASLPLVLLVVVGANLLTLVLWMLLQFPRSRIAPGIGAVLLALWRRGIDRGRADGKPPPDALLRVLASGNLARWSAASLVHLAWLSFAIGAVLALAVLLSVRAYALSWETTLLDAEALTAWARLLSVGPALLGVPGADRLPVVDAGDAAQAWSLWLVTAAIAYGVLPRAIALAASLAMLWRAQRALASDPSRPGFARLRTRLLPDHQALGTVDAAPPVDTVAPRRQSATATPVLRGRVHGLCLESSDRGAPPLADVDWVWLGAVDDAGSRESALQRLRGERVEALAIRVRATMTPDRGIERFIGELAAAAPAPATLLLDDLDRLRARGADVHARRLDDWQRLADRNGVAVQGLEAAA